MQAAVRDLVEHPVDLRCSHQGSSGSSVIAEGNGTSCHALWWPTSCETALVSGCQLQSCCFPVDSLSREKKKAEVERANELPTFYPHNQIPSPSVTGKAVNQL